MNICYPWCMPRLELNTVHYMGLANVLRLTRTQSAANNSLDVVLPSNSTVATALMKYVLMEASGEGNGMVRC